jgi:hypothetical protein
MLAGIKIYIIFAACSLRDWQTKSEIMENKTHNIGMPIVPSKRKPPLLNGVAN